MTQCFVIMPFGEKTDVDGRTIDFDAIHENVISDAITGAAMRAAGGPAIECVRCDKIAQSGWVHRQMIEAIHHSEVVVVDLSTLNPNVFYELGVRHALRNQVTVLISRKGTKTPFNLQGFKYIAYDADTGAGRASARKAIAQYVANGLKSGSTDSLVHEVLDLRGPGAGPKQLQPAPAQFHKLAAIGENRRIGLLTGDLRYITEPIDVWVNSENTNMQMARFFDKSGSAVIRYAGAKLDVAGQVVQDTIADELARQMGAHRWVPPATVIVTGAGELANSHGVKRLFHVAAVEGGLGIGYAPVKDVAACVNNVLARADARDLDDVKPGSMLLPLLGTGSGGADLDTAIGLLLEATVAYFQRAAKSRLTVVYFQAFTDRQLESCRRALQQRGATLA
jgi:hypothetical protein